MTKSILIFFVHFYKKTFSVFFPPSCRFSPTCSDYMIDSINKYGSQKGFLCGLKRIFRCHPFSKKSGWDPA